ncbi:MAG: carboxypeptidase regulatory-like domain-containing protein, partial [Planctomycetes bacterium]|nr:carboxypeptidase regulatory-like domain-containing protein [Planctomycetota bacterium]
GSPSAGEPGPAPVADRPPLRGVSGLVRDAQTQLPIPGAWITWRLPPPAVVEQVLADPGFSDPRFAMISDAAGRFAVERLPDDLPGSFTLFAVAPGYAYRALTVGLARELVVELTPMGTLEVRVRGEDPPRVSLTSREHAAIARELPAWGDDPTAFRIAHLPPGVYGVRLESDPSGSGAEVVVLAGQLTRVELTQPPRERLAGRVAAHGGGPLAGASLAFVHAETFARVEVEVDAAGDFACRLPAGRYAAFVVHGDSERRVGELVEPGRGPLLLEPGPSASDSRLRLTCAGGPLRSRSLGIARVDAPLTSLLFLSPDPSEPGVYVCAAEPGRYALFDGVCFWGVVPLPGSPTLDLSPRTLEVELGLGDLEAGERVRGELALVPLPLLEGRPDLAARLPALFAREFVASRDRARLRVPLGAAGAYVLVGQSDLGPFRERVDLTSGEPVVRCELALSGR